MCNICVFAGTTEGRELVEFLAGQPVQATVCVATEYGETLLPEAENITVLAGRIPYLCGTVYHSPAKRFASTGRFISS